MRRSAEVGMSDRIVLRCPECGELTMLLVRKNDWYREGSGRSSRCACGAGVRLAHHLGEKFLDLPGLPGPWG